jgi:hypothetical protein
MMAASHRLQDCLCHWRYTFIKERFHVGEERAVWSKAQLLDGCNYV